MTRRRVTLVGAALLIGGFVGCAIDPLNPQPLPPGPPEATVSRGDSGAFSGDAKSNAPIDDQDSAEATADAAAGGAHEGGLPPSADAGTDADAGPDAADAAADADAASAAH